MVSPALEILGVEMPRLAKRAARESGIRLMVHIGDTTGRYGPTVTRELLPLLEPGDNPHPPVHGQSWRRAGLQRQALTVKAGRTFEPEWGPHPWGWEPQPFRRPDR